MWTSSSWTRPLGPTIRILVTSDLGALPETGAGFIDLTPPLADADVHADAFADRVIQLLAAWETDRAGTEARLQA